MTATTLPLLVACFSCRESYVIPNGPPVLQRYHERRAGEWFNANHAPCSSVPVENA